MEKLFSFLASIHNRLFDSKRLLSYEKLCLESWRSSLSDNAKHILDSQLAALQFVQRQAAGAKVCFFERKNKGSLFLDNNDPDLHVATVILKESSGKQMQAKIFVHRGLFFSIEFPKRPERYFEQHDIAESSLQLSEVITHVAL